MMDRTACATLLLVGAAAFAVATGSVRAVGPERLQSSAAPFPGMLDEHPAIGYAQRPTHDAISRLNAALAQDAAALRFLERGGYLQSVLQALGIAPESQVLVFSKS